MSVATDLPDLTADEAEHSARLEARVREEFERYQSSFEGAH